MEEKDMRELSMEDMDKVSGGTGDTHIEVLFTSLEQAGLLPELSRMIRKKAVQKMLEFWAANGLSGNAAKANAIYDTI